MIKGPNQVYPDLNECEENNRIISPNSMIMSIFESNTSLNPKKKSVVSTDSYKDILKAVENWNLKEIISMSHDHHFSEENVFRYQIPFELRNTLAPIFWKTLEDCNLLHYACLYRATRTVKALISPSFSFDVNATTQDGVTALHISAAIGDFYTIRELLLNGANRNLVDKNGRLPMHYAVYTNIETCIILTNDDSMDLRIEDESSKTILKHSKIANKPYIEEYIETLDKKDNHLWIPQNISQFDCVSISLQKEDNTLCKCGQSITDHYSVFPKYDCEENDFIEKPTNYFGEIEFSSLYRGVPYIRLSKNTTYETLASLLVEQWLIETPSLVISIYGSDFEGHAMKDILKKGIWKSAGNEGTHVWIITNGIATNSIQVVGEAVRDFTDAYGEDQIYAIAMLPWSFIEKTDFLYSNNYQGNYPTEYQSAPSADNQKPSLDKNHSHYIFVDIPETKNREQCYLNYRLKFEKAVSNLNEFFCNSETTPDPVPLCGILVSGSREDLKLLHGSMIKNGKPSVVIKGSGGLANLIGFILDEISDNNRKRKTLEEALDKDNLRMLMSETWEVIDDFEEEIAMIREVIENQDLLEIFSLEEDLANELDKKILSSLLSQA